MSEILPYLGFEPHYSEQELSKRAIPVPNLQGLSVTEAKNKVTAVDLIYKVVGDGDTVISQLPASGDTLYAGGLVIIYTESESANEKTVTVPDFTGKTVSEVNSLAAENGINVKFSGNTLNGANTLSFSQSIDAGTKVNAGTSITVYFRDDSVTDFIPED